MNSKFILDCLGFRWVIEAKNLKNADAVAYYYGAVVLFDLMGERDECVHDSDWNSWPTRDQ